MTQQPQYQNTAFSTFKLCMGAASVFGERATQSRCGSDWGGCRRTDSGVYGGEQWQAGAAD